MNSQTLLLPILVPLAGGLFSLLAYRHTGRLKEVSAVFAAALNFIICAFLFNRNLAFSIPWVGSGIEFSLRLYNFSAFIMLSVAFFVFLVSLYSLAFMRKKNALTQFYAYLLISAAFANGAVLADNLVLMLFFWEGLLLTLFGMIAIGNKKAFKTATKAFIIVGIADLCMMAGIALTGHLAGTLTTSKINLPLDTLGSIAFILLMIGAICKGGSMPFHSWIPDAAEDSPLPFMALVPSALDKLLGIYFLTRISLDIFKLNSGSWISPLLMAIGSITIILAVMMALVQKEYKRLLSYHAISQMGYMVLGIGTCVPVGIVGGIFHMVNNALYKSCLFLTGGAVEKEAGTTKLEKLGGLRLNMPVTFTCFFIAALSISGVPPFNGFFSKELIYDAALERGAIFYLAAIAGSFLTAASFLKLGHSAFLGKRSEENKFVKEAPFTMLIPMILIALTCIVFGVYNKLPLSLLVPVLGERAQGHNILAFAPNYMLISVTVVVLLAALFHHIVAAKKMGGGLKAAEHIHRAPVLSVLYDRAEKRYFDPYDIGLKFVNGLSSFTWWVDRKIDWIYDNFTVKLSYAFSDAIRRMHTGNYASYIVWSLLGAAFVIRSLLR